ncbi:MAG: hypothetical protein RMX63_34575 [Aulosira sp. ZfuCHP01]|nr:hypothetical protein [Aulosira sp. ZfuVER01]MDZ8002340.1 hypothetical protein [Aulosira sp. DedVER01a]MDZ8056552.1 hypothetical protein [Aulosira sp. ZfuCHP01]
MTNDQNNLLTKLQAIEVLLEEAIRSPEYQQMYASSHYRPDVTLGDALQGVRQAAFSCQQKKIRIPYTNNFVSLLHP